VLAADLPRGQRQCLGEGQDRPKTWVELSPSPVEREAVDQAVVMRECTERRPVMRDSVAAPVRAGDRDRDGLPLRA
jgi:hypothetical protein